MPGNELSYVLNVEFSGSEKDLLIVQPIFEIRLNGTNKSHYFIPNMLVYSGKTLTYLEIKEYIKCDLFVHSVLSLKGVLPALLFLKKWFVIHHTCYFRVWDQNETKVSRLKKFFSHFAHNICVSDADGKSLGLKRYSVVHNSYDNSLFKNYGSENRKDFVFVGR